MSRGKYILIIWFDNNTYKLLHFYSLKSLFNFVFGYYCYNNSKSLKKVNEYFYELKL